MVYGSAKSPVKVQTLNLSLLLLTSEGSIFVFLHLFCDWSWDFIYNATYQRGLQVFELRKVCKYFSLAVQKWTGGDSEGGGKNRSARRHEDKRVLVALRCAGQMVQRADRILSQPKHVLGDGFVAVPSSRVL